MENHLDIPQLRINGRSLDFCLGVTPQYLMRVSDVLVTGCQHLSTEDQDNLIATIGNILLLNRSLDSGPIKNRLLSFLNDISRTTQTNPQYDRQVYTHRLYFLLGIGDHSTVEPSVWTGTLDILHSNFESMRKNCPASLHSPGFHALATELLKALVNIYAADRRNIREGFRQNAIRAFIQTIKEDLSVTDSIMHNLLTVLMLSFSDLSLLEQEISENSVDFCEFVQALIGLLRVTEFADEAGNITDFISVYSFLVEILQVLKKLKTTERLRIFIHELLRREMLPYVDQDLFRRNVGFLAEDQVSDPRRICLRGLILRFYFLICYDWSGNEGDVQVREFLGLFGYILAKQVLDSEGKSIPPDINIANAMQPNPQYLLVCVGPPLPALGDVFQNAIASRRQSISVEMSHEEKEREAEKLFVLFDRMERSAAFQGFKNPCRQWHEPS